MKKLVSVVIALVMLVCLTACKDEPKSPIVGSWYFVGEEYHFMEFYEDGTAKCQMIPEIEYTYTFDGEHLTLTTADFTMTYDCTIDEDGYLTYTWFDNGTPVTEKCEKR